MHVRKLIGITFLLFVFAACKEKYLPKLNQQPTNYLVVEGFINSGTGPTTFRLSRSMKVIDTGKYKPELQATVSVRGNDNSIHPLTDRGNGIYSANQLTLDPAKQYRLHIRTKDFKEYVSDFVELKTTPAIDSISWTRNSSGVEVAVNTHDAQAKTRYYKWEYEETWHIRSAVTAMYDYRNKKVVEIDPYAEKIIDCWKSAFSTQILLGSSAALTEDVVSRQPLVQIPNNSEKLHIRYSILVKQYALTKEAYEFFRLMKKNTEELGSIFGPLPSTLKGNIRNAADPNEIVIGYVPACTAEEKRIFITSQQLPGWNFILGCEQKTVPNVADSLEYYFTSLYRPYAANAAPSGNITEYLGITPLCADCRLRGGSNVKPAFW